MLYTLGLGVMLIGLGLQYYEEGLEEPRGVFVDCEPHLIGACYSSCAPVTWKWSSHEGVWPWDGGQGFLARLRG